MDIRNWLHSCAIQNKHNESHSSFPEEAVPRKKEYKLHSAKEIEEIIKFAQINGNYTNYK